MQNRDIRPETAPATTTCVRVPCSGQRSGLVMVRSFPYGAYLIAGLHCGRRHPSACFHRNNVMLVLLVK